MARDRKRQQDTDLQERVVYIHRVSKTVKGGRRMSLVALVVVGDGKGNVGIGQGRSAEVPLAIQKGVEDAKRNMFKVPLTETGSVPHAVTGRYGAGSVLIKPAFEGTGVIAGGQYYSEPRRIAYREVSWLIHCAAGVSRGKSGC